MKFTLLIFLIFISGCSPYIGRGDFELVSTENTLKKFEVLSENRVEGRSCFDLVKSASVSYTHLTLPTICSV